MLISCQIFHSSYFIEFYSTICDPLRVSYFVFCFLVITAKLYMARMSTVWQFKIFRFLFQIFKLLFDTLNHLQIT